MPTFSRRHPETPLQNQEVKPSAFLYQEQEPQPFTQKPHDSFRTEKRQLQLILADRYGEGFTRFLVRFTDRESNPFSAPAVSPSQKEIVYQHCVLNRLSGYSDDFNFTMSLPIYQIAAQRLVSSKGGLLPYAFY